MGLNREVQFSDIKKYRNTLLNVLIIIFALIIASNINKNQLKEIYSLSGQKEMEIKKNAEFDIINKLEKKNSYFKNILGRNDSDIIINTISDAARESNAKIVSIRPDQEARFPQYSKLSFEISLTVSSYHDLGNFISKIESSSDVYLVENMIAKRESRVGDLSVSLRLSSIKMN